MKETKNIQVRQCNLVVELDNGKVVKATILKGGILDNVKGSFPIYLKAQRETIQDNIVQEDITFNNITAALAFVCGAQQKLSDYAKVLGLTPSKRSQKVVVNAPVVALSSTTQGTQENAPIIEEEEELTEEEREQRATRQQEAARQFMRLDNLLLQCRYIAEDGTPLLNPRTISNYLTSGTYSEAVEQLVNFADITGATEEYCEELRALLVSVEGVDIFKELKKIDTYTQVNERFLIYYGGGGLGKTTQALKEYPNALIMNAKATADPCELFGKFDMKTKQFVPSALTRAMEEGRPIIIDEFIHFNDECLICLQAILDNKTMLYEETLDRYFTINKGFKIIATMNKTRAVAGALASRAHLVNFGTYIDYSKLATRLVK